MTITVMLAALVTLLAAGGPGSWLDAKPLVNWNVAGAALPARPGPKDAELGLGGRCRSSVRPPTTIEDRALVKRGWSLVGPATRYATTVIDFAMSSADGMCRPNGYQGFVFVNGKFAGTLAPHPMDSRTDGAVSGQMITLRNANDIEAAFARYSDKDPLCCPHANSLVTYTIKTAPAPRVFPVAVKTRPN
jgi:hypothetical protein